MEEWRSVIGYEKNYEVSNNGNVRNTNTKKIKSSWIGWRGYLAVQLWKNNKSKTKTVHSLVLESFKEKRPNGYIANHKNGNKTCNRSFNLEWVTPRENNLHASRILGKNIGESHGNAKLRLSEVIAIKQMLKKNMRLIDISNSLGINYYKINNIKHGSCWSWVVA
jgi:hypothetical protein